MRTSLVFASAVATLSTYVSAWPYPHLLDKPLPMERMDALYRRQDNNNNNGNGGSDGGNPTDGNPDPTPTITESPENNQQSQTPSGTDSGDRSGSQSQSITDPPQSGSETGSASSNETITKGPTKTPSITPGAPVGIGSMISPNPILGTEYYRLGDKVTWTWNYTNLVIPPAAINILATTSGTSAGQAPPTPYTLASNFSFAKTETFTWDTAKFTQQNFLPMGLYTLIVYDAAASGGMTAVPSPGHLGVWEQFSFGLYSGQPQKLLPEPICATCNAAGSQMERLTLSFLFGMFLVTAGSFLWFTGPVAGLL